MLKRQIKPESPCKGCECRSIDCHIDCIGYISFRRALDRYNKKQRQVKEGINAIYDSAWRRSSTIESLKRKNEK